MLSANYKPEGKFSKSAIYSFNHSEEKVERWASIMQCVVGSFPLTYLGAQLGINTDKKVFRMPLIKIVDEKLASWKSKSLNMAGRSTLIKSAIKSIPVYWFRLNMISTSIIQELDKRIKRFFWNELENEEEGKKKLYSINWKVICKPKEKDGLGLGFLELRNLSLLYKWWYKWFEERNRPWWEVIQKNIHYKED